MFYLMINEVYYTLMKICRKNKSLTAKTDDYTNTNNSIGFVLF